MYDVTLRNNDDTKTLIVIFSSIINLKKKSLKKFTLIKQKKSLYMKLLVKYI